MPTTIAAIANIQRSPNSAFDRGIGYQGDLLIKCPEDMRHFSRVTRKGKSPCAIMGRKTWKSFEAKHRPLKGRTNIIVSSDWLQIMVDFPGVYAFPTVEKAMAWARQWHEEIWIIGGGEIYRALLLECDFLYLTEIRNTEPCDAFFPEFEKSFAFLKTLDEGFCDQSETAYTINLYARIIRDERPE